MSILLIHGVGGRPRSWDGVLERLDPDLRRQAIAVDVRVSAGQSVVDVANDVLARYPGSHVVAGHSFGGMIAQEMALIDGARVKGLALISTIPGATPRVAAINRGLADDIEERGLETVAAGFGASLFAPERLSTDPHLGTEFVDTMLDAGTVSVCTALRAIAHWDATDRLPSLTCPVVVMTGAAEADLDRQAVLAQLIGARFEVFRDVGHLAPLEAPEDVARVITEIATAVTSTESDAEPSQARGSS